jgi:hypothetical protein
VALAARVPPVRDIVLGEVVVKVPPHAEELPETIVKPAGRTSENETPDKAVLVFGLVMVKVNVLVLP